MSDEEPSDHKDSIFNIPSRTVFFSISKHARVLISRTGRAKAVPGIHRERRRAHRRRHTSSLAVRKRVVMDNGWKHAPRVAIPSQAHPDPKTRWSGQRSRSPSEPCRKEIGYQNERRRSTADKREVGREAESTAGQIFKNRKLYDKYRKVAACKPKILRTWTSVPPTPHLNK